MTLGDALLGRVREGSQELWRGVRRRMGIRLVLAVLLVHGAFFGILWLLGGAWQGGSHREVALGVARVLLPAAGLCGGVLMAFRGSLGNETIAPSVPDRGGEGGTARGDGAAGP